MGTPGRAKAGPRMPSAARVHFCHGLESGPFGFKFRKLSEAFSTVSAPDMHMSLWNPLQCNSAVRNMLRLRSPAEALADSFEACVEVQRQALQALQASAAPPDVRIAVWKTPAHRLSAILYHGHRYASASFATTRQSTRPRLAT